MSSSSNIHGLKKPREQVGVMDPEKGDVSQAEKSMKQDCSSIYRHRKGAMSVDELLLAKHRERENQRVKERSSDRSRRSKLLQKKLPDKENHLDKPPASPHFPQLPAGTYKPGEEVNLSPFRARDESSLSNRLFGGAGPSAGSSFASKIAQRLYGDVPAVKPGSLLSRMMSNGRGSGSSVTTATDFARPIHPKAPEAATNTAPPAVPAVLQPKKQASDSSLMTSMACRLRSLERVCARQAKNLGRQQKQLAAQQCDIAAYQLMVERLRKRCAMLESNTSEPEASSAEVALLPDQMVKVCPSPQRIAESKDPLVEHALELDRTVQRYRRQVKEMTKFLHDYNLQWNGYTAEVAESVADHKHVGNPPVVEGMDEPQEEGDSSLFFDVSEFKKSLTELNSLLTEADREIITGPGGVTRFAPLPLLSLTVYKNGLFIGDGPLREYAWSQTKSFVRDILDGYFPTELKSKYPKGVRISMRDQSEQDWAKESVRKAGEQRAEPETTDTQPSKPKAQRNFDKSWRYKSKLLAKFDSKK